MAYPPECRRPTFSSTHFPTVYVGRQCDDQCRGAWPRSSFVMRGNSFPPRGFLGVPLLYLRRHRLRQINDSEKLVKHLDERERQSLSRIKETQELIETNRRLIERSRELSAMVLAGLATGFEMKE